MYGKLYAELDVKWLFLSAVAIFEIGSIVCAAAPSSAALIVGRAVAGLGSAGITTGAMTVSGSGMPGTWKRLSMLTGIPTQDLGS
jgi:MFS family permease